MDLDQRLADLNRRIVDRLRHPPKEKGQADLWAALSAVSVCLAEMRQLVRPDGRASLESHELEGK